MTTPTELQSNLNHQKKTNKRQNTSSGLSPKQNNPPQVILNV